MCSQLLTLSLAGDWAEGVWSDNLSYAGQVLPGSCASQTGYETCAAYVKAEGQDFKHGEPHPPITTLSQSLILGSDAAYWKINSLAIYKS